MKPNKFKIVIHEKLRKQLKRENLKETTHPFETNEQGAFPEVSLFLAAVFHSKKCR